MAHAHLNDKCQISFYFDNNEGDCIWYALSKIYCDLFLAVYGK